MSTFAAADRNRLSKLLALLGSDHVGERAAAGAAAHQLIQRHGLSWAEVIEPAAVESQPPEIRTWRMTVTQCLEQPGSLRPWERKFLSDLPGFPRLSGKQRHVLQEIAERVLKQ